MYSLDLNTLESTQWAAILRSRPWKPGNGRFGQGLCSCDALWRLPCLTMQAMDVIMARVEALQAPLKSAEDCDAVRGMGVGKDNIDKLKEIVRTGAFRRNERLAADPHHQTVKLVGEPCSQIMLARAI